MTTIDQSLTSSDVPEVKPHPGRRMTEEEFVEWSGDAWVEWVDGEVIVMSPVNRRRHTQLFGFIHRVLAEYVEQRDLGEVLTEPFQMRLGQQRRRRSPDLMFVGKARKGAVRPTYLEGPADLIIEIVSPESLARDWREKYLDYEAGGVREYWVIDPMSQRAETYALGDNRTFAPVPEVEGKINSAVVPGFYLRPQWLWEESMPKVADALREMGVTF